ncbi:DoxX-like family protein [Limnohabitans sp.]|uniref:DoxX-like family protein n=1 Tax=Limnohabitans sp. TaxID=1907725 RepID=UPI0037C07581
MLRMLAAFPWIQPIAMPHAAIQTVWLDDVAGAVAAAVDGRLAHGFETDLVESEVHSLRDVLAAIRHWLGFAPARFELSMPHALTTAIAKGADALSQLGWRSPLRSTAISVLAQGVRGKPADLSFAGLPAPSSLDQTLSQMSVGAQDRLHARMSLLAPFMVLSLGLFWWASGVIGLVQVKQAALVLEKVGWSNDLAIAGVVFWAMVDMAIGTAFAIRQYSQAACWASAGVSVFYLLASTMTIPSLWMDPLGPLVKVVPVIVLSLVTSAALDTR